jgi:hypothetical protein
VSYVYHAVTKRGSGIVGKLPADTDITSWVEGRFALGWRRLRVTGTDGTIVGAISNDGRLWWCEDDTRFTAGGDLVEDAPNPSRAPAGSLKAKSEIKTRV